MITAIAKIGLRDVGGAGRASDDTCAFQVRPSTDGQPAQYSNVVWRVEHPACQSFAELGYLPLCREIVLAGAPLRRNYSGYHGRRTSKSPKQN